MPACLPIYLSIYLSSPIENQNGKCMNKLKISEVICSLLVKHGELKTRDINQIKGAISVRTVHAPLDITHLTDRSCLIKSIPYVV